MSTMFRSLRVFNYRVWFIGALVSNVGAWMQATAQDWVVLTELTDHDATAVGFTIGIQFRPAARTRRRLGMDRRPVRSTEAAAGHAARQLALLSVLIGTLLLTDLLTLPIMLGIALAVGVANAIDNPARQAFVTDVVSRQQASNAVALNSASFNMARLIGPAVGSVLLLAVGSGWVFIINAATFGAMLAAILLMRKNELQPRTYSKKGTGRLSEGVKYVWGRPDLLVVFIMVFLMGAFGMNFPIFASTMAVEFGRDADGYGLLSSTLAVGSLAGALLAARRARARVRVAIVAVGAFGVFQIAAALTPLYLAYAAVCILIGFCTVSFLTTANGYVQTTTDPALRGRVLALYLAVMMGSTPIGAPIIGAVADAWGPRTAIIVGGVAGVIAALIGLFWLVGSGRLHRSERGGLRLALDETRPIDIITTAIPQQPSMDDTIVQSTTAQPELKDRPELR